MHTLPLFLIFLPIATACLIYLVHRPWISRLAFLCQGLLIAILARFSMLLKVTGPQSFVMGNWPTNIGIELRNDCLSLSYLWLTLLLWSVILLYIWPSRKDDYKFLFFLLFLEGAFAGLLQANDLFTLFVFIDITTILSTLLIIYEKNGAAIKSGVYYLLFNAVGMLFYQLGMILLFTSLGTLNISLLTERLALSPHSQLLRLARVFFMAAIGVKSAFFPVYTWLPRAHSAAPSAISALLSGLLVKSGLYAFIRMESMFPLPDLNEFFFWLGLVSAASGMIFALSQTKLKQLLAYSTVSQIGLIVMGVSHPGTVLYLGGITHLFNHALIKCLLFLCAGIIIKSYGRKKIRTIRGVFKTMPALSMAMIIGMVSITGGFLTNGYMSKSLLAYGLEDKAYAAQFIYHAVNLGTLAYFLKVARIFFGPAQPDVKGPDSSQLAAVCILAAACLIIPWANDPLWAYFGQALPHIDLFKGSKAALYGSQILIGLALSRQLFKREPKAMKTIRDFQFGFGASNGLMLLFLLLMTMASKLI